MRINYSLVRTFILLLICCNASLISAEIPQFIAFNTKDALYISSNSGLEYQRLDILKSLNKSVYLTAAARNQKKPEQIVVGTSFEGIFESVDSGKTWKKIETIKTFRPYFQGSGYYDEIIALAYADDGSDDLFFKLGFNKKSYRLIRTKKTTIEIDVNNPVYINLPQAFNFNYDFLNLTPKFEESLPKPEKGFPLPDEVAKNENNQFQPDPERLKRRELAANKVGMYLNPNQAKGNRLIKQLEFAVANKLNSIVVDFKDDQGNLTYASQLPIVKDVKSINARIDVPTLINEAHKRNIYVIARIVVFKDKQLAKYQNAAYSIWDKTTNSPWGVFRQEKDDKNVLFWKQTEYWVDPYSEFVHDYNINIAKEAQSLGVDEIQFDYIRFPSDGNTVNLYCRYHKDAEGITIKDESDGQKRVSVLTKFLSEARENLTIPIGTDVFGFNGWARMSYLGQDIQAFSYYVDVISPMMYPSHYSLDFLSWMKYFDRASFIYEMGTQRARIITNNRSLIRPYIQAFLLGGETKWEEPQYFDYLNRQIKSGLQGGASGFTLWNNLGNYYMVDPKIFPTLIAPKNEGL